MNKSDLVERIANDAGITKIQAHKALDAFISASSKALEAGEKITLVGFGTFSVVTRAARTGRNPQSGKPIKIAAKQVIKFKAGSLLASDANS
jgi:DNA-binding protein HU-beta